MIAQLVRKQIRNMQEINWGDIPENTGMRLLWGENQELLPIYKSALQEELDKVNLYPSPTKQTLKEKLAEYNGVKPENIVPTNGSDEALELIAKVFIAENDQAIVPTPSYPCFTSVSGMMGAQIIYVPLENDFALDINKLQKKINTKTKIIWIANPNNPTGNILIPQEQLETFIKNINCIIVFDECYFELANVTANDFIQKYPNVIITRSFSKVYALAGVRLGYIIANQQVTKYLNTLQQTNQVFNINRFALAAGLAIIENKDIANKAISNFKKRKRDFENLLIKINGIKVFPTKTTFCLLNIRNTGHSSSELKTKLLKKDIYIKDCSIYQGLSNEYVYLGVPKAEYQEKIVQEIQKTIED